MGGWDQPRSHDAGRSQVDPADSASGPSMPAARRHGAPAGACRSGVGQLHRASVGRGRCEPSKVMPQRHASGGCTRRIRSGDAARRDAGPRPSRPPPERLAGRRRAPDARGGSSRCSSAPWPSRSRPSACPTPCWACCSAIRAPSRSGPWRSPMRPGSGARSAEIEASGRSAVIARIADVSLVLVGDCRGAPAVDRCGDGNRRAAAARPDTAVPRRSPGSAGPLLGGSSGSVLSSPVRSCPRPRRSPPTSRARSAS